jgi:cobaltochelatase CobT
VTRYYRRAVTIIDADELGGALMQNFTDLFDEESADQPPAHRQPRAARKKA